MFLYTTWSNHYLFYIYRFNENTIVLNTMENSEWQNETRYDKMVFAPGTTFTLKIK